MYRASDAIDDVSRGVSQQVYDMKGTLMGSCEDGGIRDGEVSSAAEAGTRERPELGSRSRKKP